MLFIPIGNDQGALRRWPVVTFAIMGLCLIVAFVQYDRDSRRQAEATDAMQKAILFFARNPDLKLRQELSALFGGLGSLENGSTGLFAQVPATANIDAESRAERQAELDGLQNAWLSKSRDNLIWQWGFIPARFSWTTIVTSMFVHVGALHLLFNLLFLYMTGPLVEDVWGRPAFLAFYLAGGIVAGGAYALRQPDVGIPLVGASGAIAAVMGAFFVRYPRANIRLMTFLFLRRIVFSAPAWLLLGIWAGLEYLDAHLLAGEGQAAGSTAGNWVHLWGFAFGGVVALAIRSLRVEERYFFEAIERRREDALDPLQAKLDRLLSRGDHAGACRLLAAEMRQKPDDVELADTYWRLLRGTPAAAQAAVCFRILESDLARDEGLAVERCLELRQIFPSAEPPFRLSLLLAGALRRRGEVEAAEALIGRCRARLTPASPPEEWAALAESCAASGSPDAAEIASRALAHPRLSKEDRARLERAFSRGDGETASLSSRLRVSA